MVSPSETEHCVSAKANNKLAYHRADGRKLRRTPRTTLRVNRGGQFGQKIRGTDPHSDVVNRPVHFDLNEVIPATRTARNAEDPPLENLRSAQRSKAVSRRRYGDGCVDTCVNALADSDADPCHPYLHV